MPWIRVRESDQSTYQPLSTSEIQIAGIVGTASKGEIGKPKKFVRLAAFMEEFGSRPPAAGLGWFTAVRLLGLNMPIVYERIATSSAEFASATVESSSVDALKFSAKTKGDDGERYSIKIINDVTPSDTCLVEVYFDDGDDPIESFTVSTLSTSAYYAESIDPDYVTIEDLGSGTSRILEDGTYEFADGDDGASVSDADVVNGIDVFKDSFLYDIFFLAAPGYSNATVVNKLIAVGELRKEILALPDHPYGISSTDVVDWHNGDLGGENDPASALNSSYAALYGPWLQYYNSYKVVPGNEWLPPSATQLQVFASSQSENPLWFAAAGVKRGLIRDAIATEYDVGQDILAVWQDNALDNNINPFMNFKSMGLMTFGNRTLYRTTSALQSVNVRLISNYIKKNITDICFGLQFDQNDAVLWNTFYGLLDPILLDCKNRRGLYGYEIKMDSSTTTPTDINSLTVKGTVSINPTRAGENFDITFTLTSAGVTFGS